MITLATAADLPQILAIYAHARAFMAQHGNPNQWGASRPTEADITAHIAARELYVLREADAIHGVFAFILGEDPTYRVIEQGAWLSDAPYGTIHAVASDGDSRPAEPNRCLLRADNKTPAHRHPPRQRDHAARHFEKRLHALRHHPHRQRRGTDCV